MARSTYGGGILIFFVVGPPCRPRDKKGQAEAPKTRRGHVRKRKLCTLPVYTSSASPHTTQPARALKSFPTTRAKLADSQASVSAAAHHPAGSRAVVLAPPSPALAAASPPLHALSALRRHPRLDAQPAPSHSPRTSRPARAQLFRSHDPRAPPLPLLSPRLAAATARRRQHRVLHSQ